MKTISRCWMLAAFVAFVAGPRPTVSADQPSSTLLRHLPAGGVAAVEVAGLAPLLERLQTSEAYQSYLSSPAYHAFVDSNPGKKLRGGQAILEAQLGQDVWSVAKNYLGRRIVLAIYPPTSRPQPDGVVVIEAKDASAVDYLREKLKPLVALAADKITPSDRPDGGWQLHLPDANMLVLINEWLVASNNPSLLELTLKQLREPPAESLADDENRRQMTAQLGEGHLIQGWINLEWIRRQQDKRLIPRQLDNPVGSLLLGGLLEIAEHSPYAGATVDVGERDFRIQLGVAGQVSRLDAAHQGYFQPADFPSLALPSLEKRLGGFTVYRDVQAWYQHRESLLIPQLMPEFDKFETGLSNLLPGKDFGTDVLPLFGRRWTFVAAPQSFAHLKGKPGMQLPAFGVVIDLARPDEGADLLQLFFQTLTTILNIEAGQKGRQSWVMSSETYRDVQLTFAKYLAAPEGDALPASFNFQPAMARVRDRFIAATSAELCRSLVDALTGEATASPSGGATENLVLELSPAVAAELLKANASLILARSVQSGKSTEQAQQEFATLIELLQRLEPIRLRTLFDDEAVRLELTGGWK